MTAHGNIDEAGPCVLLIGGDVTGDLGARAARAAIAARVRRACAGCRIAAHTAFPARDREQLGIDEAVRSLPDALSLAREGAFDAVLWGGGRLLHDGAGPLSGVRWLLALSALRWIGRCPIVGCGPGIGPLDSVWGQLLARGILRQFERMIVRDERSSHCVRRLVGYQLPLSVAPDPVAGLEAASYDDAFDFLRSAEGVTLAENELVIGVAPRPGPIEEPLAAALNRAAAGQRTRFLLFPFHAASRYDDERVCEGLAHGLVAPAHVLRLDCAPAMAKALAGVCDIFVSTRFHAGLMALGVDAPTIAVSEAPDEREVWRALDEEDRFLEPGEVTGEEGVDILEDILRRTADRRDVIAEGLARKWPRYAEGCLSYEHMLKLVLTPP